ncbi:MAG: TRAP transporter substrate-binding protein [Pseudomonadota bacterium]
MGIKKTFFVSLLFVLLAIPLSLAGAQEATKAQKIKLSLAHIYTPNGWEASYAVPALFRLVEKHTKGKYILDIGYYPAGTLLAPADIFGGVTKGIADIGWTNPGINPGLFPVMTTLSQPGIAPAVNAYANALTWWEFYNKFKPKEFNDVKVLLWCGVGPGWIHSKKPIRSAEDIKGLKVRCIGPGVEAIRALGAEPIGLPSSDIYLAGAKGVIDAALIPMGAVAGYKLDEVFTYSTCVPPLYNAGKYCVMNRDKWKALPKDLQAAFDAVAEEGVNLVGRIWDHFDPVMTLEEYLPKLPKTHQIIYLPETETAKLRELMKPIRSKYVASLNEKGLPGEEMVSEAGKIVEKNNQKKYKPWKTPAK